MKVQSICDRDTLSGGVGELESGHKKDFVLICSGEFTSTGYRTDAEKECFSDITSSNGEVQRGDGVNWRYGVSGSVRSRNEENHPVVHVSWSDAIAYCEWLSKQTGKKFRLPTEAEREYACRAGTTTPFSTGKNLTSDQANDYGNYPYNNNQKRVCRQNTVAADSFAPNAWGLYNMHGNVSEWSSDWFGGTYYDDCKAKGVCRTGNGFVPCYSWRELVQPCGFLSLLLSW